MAISNSTNLNTAVDQAVTFLTTPLSPSHSASTIIRIQLILKANLIALFGPTWVPKEPSRGSGRRCLTLSPDCLPPRAIYTACLATGVQWFDWIALLGGYEFDLLVDPGRVYVRRGPKAAGGKPSTVWFDELDSVVPPRDEAWVQSQLRVQTDARAKTHNKTFAQQLLENDKEEDDMIFAMIADEVTDPAWTPIIEQFPSVPPRSSSPFSTISTHSRSSSRSSTSSAGLSFSSSDTFDSMYSASSSPASRYTELPQQKISRRERARQARVFVDTSKNEVTPYDGGKTTVLTGGVMLGAKAPTTKIRSTTATALHRPYHA